MAERWDEIKDRADAFREEHFGEKIENENTSEAADTETPLNEHLDEESHEALAADMADEDSGDTYGAERGTFGEQIGTETTGTDEEIDSDADFDTSAFESNEDYDFNR